MTTDAGVPGAPRFDVVLRGYDRRQVDEHVDRLQRVLARMRADLEVARSQPMPAVTPGQSARPRPTPRPRPGGPADNPDTIDTFTDRMESILAAAEEEAAEIRRNAHLAARAETDGVRSQVADLVRQRDSVLAELTRMRSQLEGLLAAPTAQMPA
ncbi:DivIVA domain-containing protein, partial [Pseudonocardia abyssalis]